MRDYKSIAHFILEIGDGGAESLVRILTSKLRLNGFTNIIICFDNITSYKENLQNEGVKVELLKRRQVFFDFSLVVPILNKIKKENIHLIHAHDLSSLSYGIVAALFSGAKVIMTEHSRHYIDEKFIRRLEKRLLISFAHHLVEVSNELKEASLKREKIPEKKISVIENGVDIQKFSQAKPIKINLDELGPNPKKILVVGRLEEIKGQKYAIEALKFLDEFNVHLLLVGDGSQKEFLLKITNEMGLKNRVHFLGQRNDVEQVMKIADILLIPSESEGLPFVILEAMASGLPVIATAVGAIPELLGTRMERGILIRPKDPIAMAEAIKQIFKTSSQAKQMVRNAFQFVSQNYSQEKMLNNYKELYLSLLSTR